MVKYVIYPDEIRQLTKTNPSALDDDQKTIKYRYNNVSQICNKTEFEYLKSTISKL